MVEGDNQVAGAKSGLVSRRIGAQGGDEKAGAVGVSEAAGKCRDEAFSRAEGVEPQGRLSSELEFAADPAALVDFFFGGGFGCGFSRGATGEEHGEQAGDQWIFHNNRVLR